MDLNLILIWVFTVLSKLILVRGDAVCTSKLREVGKTYMELHQCVIYNDVPVKFCGKCLDHYVAHMKSYHDLLTTNDKNDPEIICSSEYIDQNKLNLVENEYMHSKSVWNDAHCNDCFVPQCDPEKIEVENVSSICFSSEHNNKTLKDIESLNSCEKPVNGSFCTECLPRFNEFTTNFTQLQSNGGVCFEIDLVNRTSNEWLEENKCPRPSVTIYYMWYLLLLIPLGGSFGGGFYYAVKKYREREIDYVPNDFNAIEDEEDDPPLP